MKWRVKQQKQQGFNGNNETRLRELKVGTKQDMFFLKLQGGIGQGILLFLTEQSCLVPLYAGSYTKTSIKNWTLFCCLDYEIIETRRETRHDSTIKPV